MVVMEGLSKYNYLPVNYLNQIGGVSNLSKESFWIIYIARLEKIKINIFFPESIPEEDHRMKLYKLDNIRHKDKIELLREKKKISCLLSTV